VNSFKVTIMEPSIPAVTLRNECVRSRRSCVYYSTKCAAATGFENIPHYFYDNYSGVLLFINQPATLIFALANQLPVIDLFTCCLI
jgi:hypothetical protein